MCVWGSLKPLIYSWLVRSPGDNLGFWLAWVVVGVGCGAGGSLMWLSLWDLMLSLQVSNVRTKLNCRTSSWCCRELCSEGEKPSTHLVTRNVRMKVFCMRSQEDTGARETQEERAGFSPTTGGKLSFSNTKQQRKKYIYILFVVWPLSTAYHIPMYIHVHTYFI